MKSLTEQILAAKTWQERVRLAENATPGTPFDSVFKAAREAEQFKTLHPPIARQNLEWLGACLVTTINKGDSVTLHRLADALNVWKRHRAKPDPVLVVLFSLAGMFQAGWKKNWITLDKAGRVARRGLPSSVRESIALRDVEANLRRVYYRSASDKDWEKLWPSQRKKAQRYAAKCGIELDPQPGRPRSK
jgi:hypothetical protein